MQPEPEAGGPHCTVLLLVQDSADVSPRLLVCAQEPGPTGTAQPLSPGMQPSAGFFTRTYVHATVDQFQAYSCTCRLYSSTCTKGVPRSPCAAAGARDTADPTYSYKPRCLRGAPDLVLVVQPVGAGGGIFDRATACSIYTGMMAGRGWRLLAAVLLCVLVERAASYSSGVSVAQLQDVFRVWQLSATSPDQALSCDCRRLADVRRTTAAPGAGAPGSQHRVQPLRARASR